MSQTYSPLLTGLLALSAPGVLLAQTNDSRGVLHGAATAIHVDGGVADSTTLVEPTGITQLAPRQFPTSTAVPDLGQILSFHLPSGVVLDTDDISTGRDDILIDQDGFLEVPNNLWSVWSFSLTRGATGAPGSRIAQEADNDAVGAALFSYILPGSNLPAPLIARVERSHGRRDLGLTGGLDTEVDAIDFPLVTGVCQQLNVTGTELDLEPGWTPLVGTKAIYFTVSHATRHLVPVAWWNSSLPSGASIFVTTRGPFSGTWSMPTVSIPYTSLGLTQDEDIDALAFDVASEKVLFSTTGTTRDQFLFVDLTVDGVDVKDVRRPNGTRVSEDIGKAEGDDVDAVCTLDPQLNDVGDVPAGGDDFGSSCGAPRDGLLGIPRLSGSAYRRYESGQLYFDTFMSGWPPPTGPAPSLAVAFLTFEDNLNLILLGAYLRDPLDPDPGNPQQYSLAIPAALGLSQGRMTFRWAHLDGATLDLYEAWPVQVWM